MDFKTFLDNVNVDQKAKMTVKSGNGPKNAIKSLSNVKEIVKASKTVNGAEVSVVVVKLAVEAVVDTCKKALKVLSTVNATECANLTVLVESEGVSYNVVSAEMVEDYMVFMVVKA